MSTGLFWTVASIVYVVLGIGTARVVMVVTARNIQRRDGSVFLTENELLFCTVMGGLFWPFAAVWLLLLRPVGIVIGPWFLKWFTAPTRKVVDQ